MEQGWIKLHRGMLSWEWYDDHNTFRLFLHLLLNANHKEKKWRGNNINAGERITSYGHLAKETGMSVQSVRTSLNKLKSTHELTIKTTPNFTLIKVNNWDKYQVTNTLANKRSTNDQQTINNKQECKNEKKNTGAKAPITFKNMKTTDNEEVYYVEEETKTPKKYLNRKKLYSRLAIYYQGISGQTGDVLRYYKDIKELVDLADPLYKDDEDKEGGVEAEVRGRIDVAAKYYKTKNHKEWGLNAVIKNWDKILNEWSK